MRIKERFTQIKAVSVAASSFTRRRRHSRPIAGATATGHEHSKNRRRNSNLKESHDDDCLGIPCMYRPVGGTGGPALGQDNSRSAAGAADGRTRRQWGQALHPGHRQGGGPVAKGRRQRNASGRGGPGNALAGGQNSLAAQPSGPAPPCERRCLMIVANATGCGRFRNWPGSGSPE